jgi:flagellar basal body P-ring formation protein FlgA
MANRSAVRLLNTLVAAVALLAVCNDGRGEELVLPTPKLVIYPGDIIQDDMLVDTPAEEGRSGDIAGRNVIIGKMARRTLLPGQPIALSDIGNPRLVVNGGSVTLCFTEGGLTISASGAAQQDGSEGELIRVRNTDSGVIVSGVVQADGSVRVGGG